MKHLAARNPFLPHAASPSNGGGASASTGSPQASRAQQLSGAVSGTGPSSSSGVSSGMPNTGGVPGGQQKWPTKGSPQVFTFQQHAPNPPGNNNSNHQHVVSSGGAGSNSAQTARNQHLSGVLSTPAPRPPSVFNLANTNTGGSVTSLPTILTGPARKQRVELKDEEAKARLVNLCCENFTLYTSGKGRFFDTMQIRFSADTGIDVNVKGYMQRWEAATRKGKFTHGDRRAKGEWERAMERWVEAVDEWQEHIDLAKRMHEETREGFSEELTGRKAGWKNFTYSRKRAREAETEDDTELENGAEASEAGTQDPHQPVTASSILESMKEGDEDMMKSLQKMHEKRLERWENILQSVVTLNNTGTGRGGGGGGKGSGAGGGGGGEHSTLDRRMVVLEEQNREILKRLDDYSNKVDRTRDKLDEILTILHGQQQEIL